MAKCFPALLALCAALFTHNAAAAIIHIQDELTGAPNGNRGVLGMPLNGASFQTAAPAFMALAPLDLTSRLGDLPSAPEIGLQNHSEIRAESLQAVPALVPLLATPRQMNLASLNQTDAAHPLAKTTMGRLQAAVRGEDGRDADADAIVRNFNALLSGDERRLIPEPTRRIGFGQTVVEGETPALYGADGRPIPAPTRRLGFGQTVVEGEAPALYGADDRPIPVPTRRLGYGQAAVEDDVPTLYGADDRPIPAPTRRLGFGQSVVEGKDPVLYGADDRPIPAPTRQLGYGQTVVAEEAPILIGPDGRPIPPATRRLGFGQTVVENTISSQQVQGHRVITGFDPAR